MFGIQPTGNFDEATGFGLPRAYAQIQWLVNGVPTTRLVSVFSGQQVTGVGEAVSIQAWDATDAVDGDPSPTYPLTCILAPGTRGSNASPPTYWPNPSNFSLEPGDTADIPIPQNVGMKSFQVLTGIEADTDVNTIIGTDIGTLFDVGQAAFSKFCPFNDPRITAVRITNTGMVNIAVGIVFGVDG